MSIFITDLLQGLISPDNIKRSTAESIFNIEKESNLHLLILNFIEFLHQSSDISLKSLSCIILRQFFTSISTQHHWQADLQTQEKISQGLLEYSYIEKDISILKQFSNVLIEFNNSLYRSNRMICHELLDFWKENALSPTATGLLALNVMNGFFGYFYDYFSDSKEILFQIFQTQLRSESHEIKFACANAFCTLISTIDTPEVMYFSQLLPKLLMTGLYLTDYHTFYAALRDAAESEPLFFSKKIHFSLEFGELMLNNCQNLNCTFLVCSFLTEICINTLDIEKENIGKIIQIIRKFMRTIKIEISDSIEIDYLDLSSELISKIIENHNYIIDEFLQDIYLSMKPSDFQSYVLSLTQFEKILKSNDIEIDLFINKLEYVQNDYARFLIVKCIENIWKHFKIKDLDIDKIFNLNLNSLIDTNYYVSNQAAVALIQFIESVNRETLQNYSLFIIQKLMISGTSINIKNKLNLFQALIRKNRNNLPLVEIMNEVIGFLNTENALDALQCIISMKKSISLEAYIPTIITSLRILNKPVDVHSLSYWELLFQHFSVIRTEYIIPVSTQLLSILATNLERPPNDYEDYLESLLCIVNYLEKNNTKIIEECRRLNERLLESNSPNLKIFASHFSSILIKQLRINNDPSRQHLAETFLLKIWNFFEYSEEESQKLEYIVAARSLVKVSNLLFKEDIKTLIASKLFVSLEKYQNFNLLVEICKFSAYVCHNSNQIGEELLKNIIVFIKEGLNSLNYTDEEKYEIIELLYEFLEIAVKNVKDLELQMILEILLENINAIDERIRNKVIHCLGLVTMNCSQTLFKRFSKRIMSDLENCINTTHKFNSKYYYKAKNNAILTAGVIILYHSECFNFEEIFAWWAGYLPIKNDQKIQRKALRVLGVIFQLNKFTIEQLTRINIPYLNEIIQDEDQKQEMVSFDFRQNEDSLFVND